MGERKYDDAELLRHWNETGSIKETARRLKSAYSGVYEQLVRLNAIRAATFNPDRPNIARTIQEGTTLVIPDLQAPAHHPDALPFLMAVRDKFKPKENAGTRWNVIGIGDEVDMNWLSNFAKLPENDQPHSEWAAAQSFMRTLGATFPEVFACTSNHVHGRLDKARERGRIPPHIPSLGRGLARHADRVVLA